MWNNGYADVFTVCFYRQDAGELSDESVDEIAHILETELQPPHSEPSSGRSGLPNDVRHFETQSTRIPVDLHGQLLPENPVETTGIKLSPSADSVVCGSMKVDPLNTSTAPASAKVRHLPLSEAVTLPASSKEMTFQSLAEAVVCSEASAAETCQLKSEPVTHSALSEPAASCAVSVAETPPALLSEAGTCQSLSAAVIYSAASESKTSGVVLPPAVCSTALSPVIDPFTSKALVSEPSDSEAAPEAVKKEPCTSSDAMTDTMDSIEQSKTDVAVDAVLLCRPRTVPSDASTESSVSETGVAVTAIEQDKPCIMSSDAATTSMVKLELPEADVPVMAIGPFVPCTTSSGSAESLPVTSTPVKNEKPLTVVEQQDSDGRSLQVTETVCESVRLKSESAQPQFVTTSVKEHSSTGDDVGVKCEAVKLDRLMPFLQQGDFAVIAVISRSSMTSMSSILTAVHNTVTSMSSSSASVASTTMMSDSSSMTSVSSSSPSMASTTMISDSSSVTSVSSPSPSMTSTTVISVSSSVTSMSSSSPSMASTKVISYSSSATSMSSSPTSVTYTTMISDSSSSTSVSSPSCSMASVISDSDSSSVTSTMTALSNTSELSLSSSVTTVPNITVQSIPASVSSSVSSIATSISVTCAVTSVSTTMAHMSNAMNSVSAAMTSVLTTFSSVASVPGAITSVSSTVTQLQDTPISVTNTVTPAPASVTTTCPASLDYIAAAAPCVLALPSPSTVMVHNNSAVSSPHAADGKTHSSLAHTSEHHVTSCSSHLSAAGDVNGPVTLIDDSLSEDELHIVLYDDSFVEPEPTVHNRLEVSEPVESHRTTSDQLADDALTNDKILSVSDNRNGSCRDSVCSGSDVVLKSSVKKSPPMSLHNSAVADGMPAAVFTPQQLPVSIADNSSADLMPCIADILADMSLFRPLSPIPNCQHCSLCDSVSDASRVMVLRKRTVTKRKLSEKSSDDGVVPAKTSASSDHV